MKKKYLYIAISIILFIIILGLLGWSLFIGKEQQKLKQTTVDLGYLGGSTGNGRSSSGSFGRNIFGGILKKSKKINVTDQKIILKPVLKQLYNLPIAGFAIEQNNIILFTDRATGHIFKENLSDGSTSRINQTTIPKVYESLFTNNGEGVIRRYLDKNENIASVWSDIQEKETGSTSLPANILEMSVSPDKKQIAFIENTPSGSDLIISNSKGEKQRKIFSSSLRGWLMEWKNNSILLTQKASKSLPGSAYIIDTKSGSKTLVLQQIPGLITNLGPKGEVILYSSMMNNNSPVLFVKNIKTEKNIRLNITTFANKCVWHPIKTEVYCAIPDDFPHGEYPDAWYQGSVHFSDSLWKINTKTALVENILFPKKSNGVSLDMINLATNKNGYSIFFKNKTDQTLWSVTIPNSTSTSTSELNTPIKQ